MAQTTQWLHAIWNYMKKVKSHIFDLISNGLSHLEIIFQKAQSHISMVLFVVQNFFYQVN